MKPEMSGERIFSVCLFFARQDAANFYETHKRIREDDKIANCKLQIGNQDGRAAV
jgi:hypothetical protein